MKSTIEMDTLHTYLTNYIPTDISCIEDIIIVTNIERSLM